MTSVIQQRWRTRRLVGDKRHALIVRVRRGFMKRGYLDERRIDFGSPIFTPWIYKGVNHSGWKAVWTPVTPWVEVPKVQSAKWTRDFDVQTGASRGTSTGTVVMDNIAFPDEEGVDGLYRAITRGYYSPERGVVPPHRRNLWGDGVTDWRDVLNAGYQIEIWEGYGSGSDIVLKTTLDSNHSYAPDSGALDRTWTGIIVDCDTEAHPDAITLTARDFGIFLTDQRLMGNNKAPEIRAPVTFADQRRTFGVKKLEGPLHVSSGTISEDGLWRSDTDTSKTDVEWIEITLGGGYYSDFFSAPLWDGMDMYVSLWLSGPGKYERVHDLPGGWVDFGAGNVPGGGPAYLRKWRGLPDDGRKFDLGYFFNIPAGSKLRISFSNLHGVGNGLYRAGTHSVAAYRYGFDPLHPPNGSAGVQAKHWIMVQDAAEVVRTLFIWAGFQEWHVEDFGWSLFAPMIYGEDKYFMDVITNMLQQGQYIFYMGPPTNDDRSIGKPHFEHIHALDRPKPGMVEVRSDTLSEALQVKWQLDDLPYAIRYRGAINRKGQTLEQDTSRRFMATYYGPWCGPAKYRAIGKTTYQSKVQIRRIAGIQRHFTQTMSNQVNVALTSNQECLFACVQAAIEYWLNAVTGQVQMPGLSRLNLNDQISVADRESAVNSRMWVTSIQSEHQAGPNGYWRMTLGGSLVDTVEMAALIEDYNYALKLNRRHKSSF